MGCLCIDHNQSPKRNTTREDSRSNNINIGNIIINGNKNKEARKIKKDNMINEINNQPEKQYPKIEDINKNNKEKDQENQRENNNENYQNMNYNQQYQESQNINYNQQYQENQDENYSQQYQENQDENYNQQYQESQDQKISQEYQKNQEEPLSEEIFLDGNSDSYDMILNFDSFEQLKKQGWTANFSPDGWKKYQASILSENIIIGVVGIKNRGKSYLLKRIMKNDPNYGQNDGFLVNTYGISCGFPILEDNNNKYQAFVTLDTAGKDNPLLQNAFFQEQDIRSIIKDQKVCEILLSDFIIKESNVLIAVIEQLSFAEQEMLISLINRLRLKEAESNIDKKKLIVIHNLMNINEVKDIQKFIDETLLKSMTFQLEPRNVKDHVNKKYDLTVYDQLIENNNNNLDIVHIVIGNNNEKEIQHKINEPAFKYIRDYIKISKLKKFDILKSFQGFMMENYKKYINANLFEDNPLEIGEPEEVKVYTDKVKTKEKIADKIIQTIKLKDKNKIKEFSFKNFFLDSSGVYYSMDPLYSSQMIKKENKDYLEIAFEMHGILKDIKTDVNYDDNIDKILIEIGGKIVQFEPDIFKGQEKKEKTLGNLKYTEFNFQVVIDKYKEDKGEKFEIEIEKKDPLKNGDIDSGIYYFLFPITIYSV